MRPRLAGSFFGLVAVAGASDLSGCLMRVCELSLARKEGCHSQENAAVYFSRSDHSLNAPAYYFSGAKVYEYALKFTSETRPLLSLRRPSALAIEEPTVADLSEALVIDIEPAREKDPPWTVGDGLASKIAYLTSGYKMLKDEFLQKVTAAKNDPDRTMLKTWIDKTYNENIGTVRDTLGEMHGLLDKTTFVDPVEVREPRAAQIMRDTIAAELAALPETLRFKRSRWEAARAAFAYCEAQGRTDAKLTEAINRSRQQLDMYAAAKVPRTIQTH